MKTKELKLSRIGNSRGVRIPADTLKRYHMGTSVMMEEQLDGIMLRSGPVKTARLSWWRRRVKWPRAKRIGVNGKLLQRMGWRRFPAEIAVDQIRTLSRSRLGERVDTLSDAEATALRRLITELYSE